MRLCHVQNATRGTCLGARVELASTQWTRLFGLLGRPGLQDGEGLWIRPSNGVHTFGMSFPIDVIGLDRDGRVLRLWNALPPQRVTALSMKVQSVLELPAGVIQRTGVAVGDTLAITIGAN